MLGDNSFVWRLISLKISDIVHLFMYFLVIYMSSLKKCLFRSSTYFFLIGFINEFGKAVGYKINTQKSLAFLYTKNEMPEIEFKEKFHFPSHEKE